MGRYILLGIVVFAASAAVVDFLSDRGMHGGQSAHLTTAERFISARRVGRAFPSLLPWPARGPVIRTRS